MTGLDLRRRRIALGLSQRGLAKLLGRSKSTINRWEDGEPIEAAQELDLALRWLELFYVPEVKS